MSTETEDGDRETSLLHALQDLAVRVAELLIEWDLDSNGLTDREEFHKALPVLGLHASREEIESLFSTLSDGQEQVDHWELFRKLHAAAAPDTDVAAAEAEARRSIEEAQTKHQTAKQSPFWSRDTGGKSINRHALRKRDDALQSWHKRDLSFEDTLGNRDNAAADSQIDQEVSSRQLQGTSLLDPNASVEEQLLHALDEHMARTIDLFHAWDEDGDGFVSRREFRRGMLLFGLKADRKSIDDLFNRFDPSGDGEISFKELSSLIRSVSSQFRSPSPTSSIDRSSPLVLPSVGIDPAAGRLTAKLAAGHMLLDEEMAMLRATATPRGLPPVGNDPAVGRLTAKLAAGHMLLDEELATLRASATPRGGARRQLPSTTMAPRMAKPAPLLVPLRPQMRGAAPPAVSRPTSKMSPRTSRHGGVRVGRSPIDRALSGLRPEASGVDVQQLAAADDAYQVLRMQTHGIGSVLGMPKIRPGSPRNEDLTASGLLSSSSVMYGSMYASPRRLKADSISLSQRFNALGMDCLHRSPAVAHECLQRALLIAPKEDPSHVHATTMCNLGAAHLQSGSSTVAIRYLLRAVQVDAAANAHLRGRVRLNLSAAYNAERAHHEALECAREAEWILAEALHELRARGDYTSLEPIEVLRAVASHQSCVCHEHLGQYTTAFAEAQRAHRLAREVLPADDALMIRLQSVKVSIGNKVRSPR